VETPFFAAYEDLRDLIEKKNPICEVDLLVNKNLTTTETHFPFDPEQLLNVLLPGDQVFVSCGVLNHYAIVWKVDKKNKKLYFLDPFFEFWQPHVNVCITSSHQVPYKYNRYLTEVSSDEVKKIVVAIITIRDKAH
jgi:hypothetical protein